MAKFFALCAEKQGFEMRAFVNFEEAMEWLSSFDQVSLSQEACAISSHSFPGQRKEP